MKSIKRILKRFFIVVLVSITLSLSVVSSFSNVYTVQAFGYEEMGISYLIEVLLGSMGLSFGHTADLENCSRSFEFYIDDLCAQLAEDPDATVKFYAASQLEEELKYLRQVGVGDTLTFSNIPALTSVAKAYLLSNVAGISYDGHGGYDGSVKKVSGVNTFGAYSDKFLNGMRVYNGSGSLLDSGSMPNNFIMLNAKNTQCIAITTDSNSQPTFLYKGGDKKLHCVYYNKNFDLLYYMNGTKYYFSPKDIDSEFYDERTTNWTLSSSRVTSLKVDFDDIYSVYLDGIQVCDSYAEALSMGRAINKYGPSGACYGLSDRGYILPETSVVTTPNITAAVQEVVTNNPDLSQADLDALVSNAIADAMAEIGAKIDVNQEINEGWLSRIFDSVNTVLGNVLGVRNDITALRSSVSDIYSGVGYIVNNINSLTNSVSAVSSAVSNITSDISLTNNNISALSDDVAENKGILEDIQSQVLSISKAITEGSSALELPEEMTDSFTVIEGGGGKEPEEEPEGDGKFIWFPNIVGVAKLLEPLLNYFTEPFQKITQALDVLVGIGRKILSFPVEIAQELSKIIEIPDLSEIIEILQAIPLRIAEALGLDVPLNNIIEILQAIPSNIGDVLGNLELPINVSLPVPQVLIDIANGVANLPSAIADAIGLIFVFDMEAVEGAADNLADTWELKLPFIPAFKQMFDISFDNEYDYPVLKIATPNIIKQFYNNDYIILFDGEDFAPYFVYVRGIIRAAIWILFAYSLLNRFKVRFHVG